MPFNLTIGSTAAFTANFLDVNGNITVPTSAQMTITYPPSSNPLTTVSTVIGMSQSGQIFVGTWPTGVSGPGAATISVTAPGQSSALSASLRMHF